MPVVQKPSYSLIMLNFILWLSFSVNAITLENSVADEAVIMIISDIRYPKNIIEHELDSGLPNNFTVLFSLSENNKAMFASTANLQITYDLWDEVYHIQVLADNVLMQERTITQKAALSKFINHLKIESVAMYSYLKPKQSYQINAQVLMNPVTTQRIEKIRRWIAKSQGYNDLSEHNQHGHSQQPLGKTSAGDSPKVTNTGIGGSIRPRFQKLFDNIMEQYIELNETPALWKSEVANATIQLKATKNAP